jgi:hypothetical protein
MSNSVVRKLADVIPANVVRDFTPWGWIDRHGVFHPQVDLRGVHWKAASISVEAVLMIESDIQGLCDAAIEATTDPKVEEQVRVEHARKQAAKNGRPAEPVKVEPQKATPLAAALAARTAK